MLDTKLVKKILKLLFSEKFIFSFIWLSIISIVLFSVFYKQWHTLPAVFMLALFSTIPVFLRKYYYRYISKAISLIGVWIIYAALALGEVFNFYEMFWWWDILLHGSSAIIFGLVGLGIVKAFKGEHIVQANPFVMSIFVFSFAVSLGVVWEIIEFSIDIVFSIDMQLNSLNDTMMDLIVDTIGALSVSFIGYRYLKSDKEDVFYRVYKYIEKRVG